MEFTRVTKKYVTIPVTATLPANAPATISGVDVALLPVGYKPTSGTTWTAATYAAGIATILIAGPDADPTGAVVLAADSDLWIRVTDSPEVDAVKVTRLSVPSPRPAPAPAVNYVTPAQLAAALAGISGGGGGAVASVNGHTGVVVLGASDVGAQAAGSYVTTADARLTDQRVPTGGSVTDAKVATGAAINADKLADGTTNKLLTATERTKLAGIATAATANATDAQLRDRATHTGTQTSATISDLTEAVQDIVGAFIGAGTGVSISYDDAANTFTVTATGGGGATDPEVVRDTIGTALLGVGNITVTVNDAADTITISTTATVNSTDAALRDRSTHTGTQSADTLTDGTTNKAFLATERTKLTGIATGATANSTDATLLARANHTGTQTSATISDLTEAVQDIAGAAIVAGSGATVTYDDTAGTITVAATGGASDLPGVAAGPAEYGASAWTALPELATFNAGHASGTVAYMKTRVGSAGTPTSALLRVGTVPTTTTLFKVAVFDAAGTQIGLGSDTTTPAAATDRTCAITMGRALVAGETVYVAVIWVGTGTFGLQATATSASLNIGQSATSGGAMFRASTQTGQADMPSTLPFASTAAVSNSRLVLLK